MVSCVEVCSPRFAIEVYIDVSTDRMRLLHNRLQTVLCEPSEICLSSVCVLLRASHGLLSCMACLYTAWADPLALPHTANTVSAIRELIVEDNHCYLFIPLCACGFASGLCLTLPGLLVCPTHTHLPSVTMELHTHGK
jgi:hypothetical protein